MANDGKEFTTTISADPAPFLQGMRAAAESAKAASTQINGSLLKVNDVFATLQKSVLGITAIFAGGAMFKGAITGAVNWNGEAGKMAKQLGVTSEQASVLNVALQHLGIDSETYTGAAAKMSKQIFSNQEAFEKLGVSVKNADGTYRPITQVMSEVNQKLAAIKNPIEQNIAGMQVYGKGWAEVRSIIKVTQEQMDAAEQRARQLGLIVGPEGAAAAKQYNEQMRDLGLVSKALEVQFGNALLPVFTQTGLFLSEEGPVAAKVFADILKVVAFAASATWLSLKDMGDAAGAMAAQAAALLHGDLDGFKAIGKARDEESAKNEAAFEKMKARFAEGMPIAKSAAPETGGPNPDFSKTKKGAQDTSRMGKWEAELAELRVAEERKGMLEGQYRELTKAAEADFWQKRLKLKDLSEQESAALTRKAAESEMSGIKQGFEVKVATLQAEAAAYKNNTDERMRIELEIQAKYQQGTKQYEESAKRITEIQRQAVEQNRTMGEMKVQATRDAQLQLVAVEEQTAQTAFQLGLITQAQLLTQQEQFEQRRTAQARAGLDQRRADLENPKLNPDRNPVEVAKVDAELETLERAHQLRLGQIRGAQAVESAKDQMQFFQGMQSSLQGSIQGILNGTQTIGQGFRNLFAGIGQSLAQTVSKMASDWIMAQLKMRLASKETSLAELNNNAMAAAGAAYNAVVGTPFIGPFLAPAAAAVAYSGVMAFGNLASAAGGFDIPGNVNPIVQTHAREMILPAKHADVIRSLADQGQGAGGGGGDQYHINIQAVDSQSVQRLFMDNGHHLVQSLRRQNRNFAFVGK